MTNKKWKPIHMREYVEAHWTVRVICTLLAIFFVLSFFLGWAHG